MADYTVEDYKKAAKKAYNAGDVKSAKSLIARGQALEAQGTKTNEADTSYSGAWTYGKDNAGKLIGKGIQSFGELTGIEKAENYGQEMAERNEQEIAEANYQRPEGADGIVKNLREGDFKNAGKSLLYGTAEAAPQVVAGTAASIGGALAVGSAPVVGTTIAIGGTVYGTLSALGETREENAEKGVDETATMQDLGTAIASGLIELLPLKGGGYTVKVLKEGLQEAGQEAVIMGNTAIKGGEYVTDEVFNRMGDAGLIGSTIGTASNTALTAVDKAGQVILKPRNELAPEIDEAAGDVARMLRETADGSGFNLKDINPSSLKGADETMNAVRRKIHSEVKSSADQIRKQIVKDLDPETLERFNNIVKASNQKVGSGVTTQEIKFVKDIAGSTELGQKMINGLYKSNALTEVYASGLKGGISQFTDAFNPFQNVGRAYGIGGSTIAGAFSGSSAFYSGGATLGLAAGGRAIDAVTGRRSKVNRFVNKNAKKVGLSKPTGTDLPLNKAQQEKKAKEAQKLINNAKKKAAQAERAKESAQMNVVKYSEGYAPNYGDPNLNQKADPRGTVHNALAQEGSLEGMSVKDIDAQIQAIIDDRLKDTNTPKWVKKALRRYDGFNKQGAMPKGDNTLHLAIGAIRSGFNYSTIQPTNPTSPTSPPAQPVRRPEVQQGIDDNRQFVQNLLDKLDADKAVSSSDRTILENSLSEFQLSLGKDPMNASQAIMDRARDGLSDQTLADKYLMPYHTRVIAQQTAVKLGSAKTYEPTGTTGSPPTAVSPTPPVLEPKPNAPEVPTTTTGGITQEPTVGTGGSSGILGVNEPTTPPVEVPTVKAVNKELPEAKALIEIGKKGSKYENGIQDWDMALEAASILGQIVNTYSSNAAMAKGKKAQGFGGTTSKGTRGVFSQFGQKKGAGGTVFTIRPFGKYLGGNRTRVEATTTLLHEIAHGITLGNVTGEGKNVGQPFKHAKNHVTGQQNRYRSGSFVESAIMPLLSDVKLSKDSPIVKEINNLQWNIKVYDKKNPSESRDVRDFASMVKEGYTEKSIKKHQKYTMNFSEAAVDPVWVYMYDPKLAKEVMPETARLIRKEFRKAGNEQIRFYSNPFAMVFATVLAMAGMSAGEDEEQTEGILSPEDGILTI
jgi:hypothetical protein